MSVNQSESFLVTGSMGCIGSWVLRHLLDQQVRVVATDLGTDPERPRLLLDDEELDRITWASLDVTDQAAVQQMVAEHEVTRIIHLAGLQIPFCKADPALGAAVNVVGTVNLLEAAREHGVSGFTYASSVGVFGPPSMYQPPVGEDVPVTPGTLYGIYKRCNEETARVYWQDWSVGSVGLRPYNVYGVGRDQGMTADIAKAILASAVGQPFHIRYGGPITLQHASDVAAIFIGAARSEYQGAAICNLRNDVTTVEAFVEQLNAQCPGAQVTCASENQLPFPADFDDSRLRDILGEVPHLPLADAIEQDIKQYQALAAAGRIDLSQLSS